MSDTSARLALPYLQAAQAQKHVTHNEALARLDLLVQLTVEDFGAETPPALPEEGQIWATGPAPTDGWAGQPDILAAWVNGAWVFVAPVDGWIASHKTTGAVRIRTPGGWTGIALADLDNLDGIGIGTTHDSANRLAVAGDATLLTHAGAGHQVKVNKATAADTASLLFQTAFGGRAEIGTAGSDDFAVKVSADGSAWTTGASFDKTTGEASFPNGARIAGATAYHRGNILGGVSQALGVPTGAVIEQGSNVNGQFIRFADGTQICLMTEVDMGSIVAAGAGTWADPYRSNPVTLTWPMPFVASPAVSTTLMPQGFAGPLESRGMTLSLFEGPKLTGWNAIRAMRMGSSNHDIDIFLSVTAVGRWV